MLQFCRNRPKIEQNCGTLSLMMVQNHIMQNSNGHPTFLPFIDLLSLILF